MTSDFLRFASLSFLVFENYAHMGRPDFDLRSDNRLAGTEKDFLSPFPSQSHTNAGFSQSHTIAGLQVK